MTRLDNVSLDELETALDEATGRKETERLIVAIIYKRGPSVPMIAEWLDRREQTIYRWFDRLESEPIEKAVRDRDRPGRPRKLDDERLEKFRAAVRRSATDAGYDADAWTTALARDFLEEEFGVEYSRRHVQRLLRDAGLTPRGPTESPQQGDDDRVETWEPADGE